MGGVTPPRPHQSSQVASGSQLQSIMRYHTLGLIVKRHISETELAAFQELYAHEALTGAIFASVDSSSALRTCSLLHSAQASVLEIRHSQLMKATYDDKFEI